MAKDNLYASVSHSKHRNMIGLVVVEMNNKVAYPRFVAEWERKDIRIISSEIRLIYKKIQWNNTFADQAVGQHLLREIEGISKIKVNAITTQKNIKDPENIELVKVMDIVEITQFLYSLKINHQIQFPKNPSEAMLSLFDQISKFTEFKTEAGNMSYYAPGDEFDHLTRALMICCFAARNELQDLSLPLLIQYGGIPEKAKASPQFDVFNDMGNVQSSEKFARLDRIRKERHTKRY